MSKSLSDKFIDQVCLETCPAYMDCSKSPGKITQCATLIIWNRQL
jgi:hypothetical protein